MRNLNRQQLAFCDHFAEVQQAKAAAILSGYSPKCAKGAFMTFVSGLIYGSGFTLAAILVATAMRFVFHFGICS